MRNHGLDIEPPSVSDANGLPVRQRRNHTGFMGYSFFTSCGEPPRCTGAVHALAMAIASRACGQKKGRASCLSSDFSCVMIQTKKTAPPAHTGQGQNPRKRPGGEALVWPWAGRKTLGGFLLLFVCKQAQRTPSIQGTPLDFHMLTGFDPHPATSQGWIPAFPP